MSLAIAEETVAADLSRSSLDGPDSSLLTRLNRRAASLAASDWDERARVENDGVRSGHMRLAATLIRAGSF